jgi:hypothetical protein
MRWNCGILILKGWLKMYGSFHVAASCGNTWLRRAALALLVVFGSCSDFILYDEFSKGEAVTVDLSVFRIVPAAASLPVSAVFNFSAQNGTPPYLWSVVSGLGSIDAGSGVYTAPAVAGNATIQAADATGATSSATLSIFLPVGLLSINPIGLTMIAGTTFLFSAGGGTPPYTYSKAAGLGSMDASGLYTAPGGAGSAIVRVTDAVLATSDAAVTIVACGVLAISPVLPSVEEGASLDFSGTGGTPGYVYSLPVAGSGGSMVAGHYTAGLVLGSGVDTVRVTDQNGLGASATTTVTVVPATPSNLVADGSFGGPGDLRLTWQDNSQTEGGFRIERKEGAGAFMFVTTVGANVTSYNDSGLSPNTGYTYRVRAYNGPLHSGWSGYAFDLSNS